LLHRVRRVPALETQLGQEVAAVQDWTTFGMVYVRPGYERGEELLYELARALEPVMVA
jgi:hypothetical protein